MSCLLHDAAVHVTSDNNKNQPKADLNFALDPA